MKLAIMTFAFCAGLQTLACPDIARSQEVPETLKGTGEVIITSGGGSWEAAQKNAFFEPFTRDTGIKVVLVPADEGKLLTSVAIGQPAADITSISGGNLERFVQKNAVEKIDYGYFAESTLAGMPEQMKSEYGVGALLYTLGVAYNTTKFTDTSKQPKNWADLFNVQDYPGKRSLPNCENMFSGALEGALMADGVAPEKLYPLDIDRGLAKIESLKSHVARWWATGSDAPASLINGEVDLAAAFNGRIDSAQKQGAPLAFSWDQSLIDYDYWVVLKNSPNAANAFKFLAYVSLAEPQAAFSKAMHYGPVNNEAFKLIPKETAQVLPGAPDLAEIQVFQNYKWWGEKTTDGRTNFDVVLEKCVEHQFQ
jgi:putative spermidine/putrescine transport system substrate-binding protein